MQRSATFTAYNGEKMQKREVKTENSIHKY